LRRLIERVEDSPDPYLKKPGYVAEREPWVTEITLRIS
jgi:hypothetical protein